MNKEEEIAQAIIEEIVFKGFDPNKEVLEIINGPKLEIRYFLNDEEHLLFLDKINEFLLETSEKTKNNMMNYLDNLNFDININSFSKKEAQTVLNTLKEIQEGMKK